MITWFVGLDSLVAIDDQEGNMTEATAIRLAIPKLQRMLAEGLENQNLVDWNVESEES
jgi:hypothetical protein